MKWGGCVIFYLCLARRGRFVAPVVLGVWWVKMHKDEDVEQEYSLVYIFF